MIRTTSEGVQLRLRVQPRASRDEVAGIRGDAIRIRLTAPPIEGAANAALIRFLARKLHLPQSAIRLEQGHKGRQKLVTILGADSSRIVARLGLSGPHQLDGADPRR